MPRFFLTCLLFAYTASLQIIAQNYPKNYFSSPLEIPLFLSGNFGELRSNHFHAGLDIKTQGVEGQKVLAVADGYVSRIRVSPYGYGKAIYVTHPNGYTSVYAHLKKYSDKINQYVEAYQYTKESFAVQIFPSQNEIQVKKGELIAYSGNSGGSGGPHLHFEIRESKTEHPINPFLFGFDIKDQINPDIYGITIYPLNDTSLINGINQPKRISTYGKNGVYHLTSHPTINLYGEFGFGIEAVDRMNGTGNSYGLYNIQLRHNEKLVFEQEMNEFAFHEGRYLNALIDYKTYVLNRKRVQRSYILKGNKLRFYKHHENKGHLIFNDGQTHQLSYKVSDINQNASTISFEVTAKKIEAKQPAEFKSGEIIRFFPYNQRNTFMADAILVDIPQGLLYDDLYFEFREEAATEKTISPIYWLHNCYTPLHSHMSISIKGKTISKELRPKSLIVSTTDGRSWYPEGGTWKGDNLTVKSRSFGGYAIAVDTTAPKIVPINIYQNSDMRNKWSISVKINDNLSGINYYRGTVDGKWILMEYDAKNDLLTYFFDEKVPAGKHQFKLIVSDGVNNTSTFEADFIR
tara:strand:- start:546 stop:2270 length:1725 start_codon:yes stop_codon:yes gene_type:complete